MHNILPTRSLLKNTLHLNESQATCSLCTTEEETLPHLFLNYIFSRILWRQSKRPINISQFANQPVSNWISIILKPTNGWKIPEDEAQSFQLFATLVMDNLWYTRNQVIHNGPIPSLDWFVSKFTQLFNDQ